MPVDPNANLRVLAQDSCNVVELAVASTADRAAVAGAASGADPLEGGRFNTNFELPQGIAYSPDGVSLAVFGLIGAVVQNLRIEKRLNAEGYGRVEPTPLGRVMGVLVLLVGIIGAIVIFL